MVSSFNVEVTLNIPRELLWKLRATKVFMDFLVESGALNRMESTPAVKHDDESSFTRKQIYVPKTVDIPDMIKSVIDESLIEITDTQVWDDTLKPFEQSFSIQPSIIPDYVQSTGKLLMFDKEEEEEKASANQGSEKRCVHILKGECTVNVPLLGTFVEQCIISNMHQFYSTYPALIDDFKKMLVKTYGDGSEESLYSAVYRVLNEDKAAQ